MKPMSIERKVDFPAPLGPSKHVISPSYIFRQSPRTARTTLPSRFLAGNSFQRSRTSMIGELLLSMDSTSRESGANSDSNSLFGSEFLFSFLFFKYKENKALAFNIIPNSPYSCAVFSHEIKQIYSIISLKTCIKNTREQNFEKDSKDGYQHCIYKH